jgi:archaellum biogenesis protein FlaJ (TadC family)
MDFPGIASSFSDMISSFAGLWYLWVIIALIPAVIMGIFTAKLANKKGYRGYFFTGFFFALIGLIYVVGLPMARDRAD